MLINNFSTILRNNRIFHSLVNGRKRQSSSWNLLFFGSDEFSLKTLRALNEDYRNPNGSLKSLEVVTNLKSKPNPVHKYAMDENLPIYNWPPSLQKAYDIGVVVSFGHLIPGNIIDAFPLGMLNVHASILPRWRGAAPIIYAIANGDKETGVTIMRIKPKKFDVGEIIQQEFVGIPSDMKMPELYNNLSNLGATTLLSVIQKLSKGLNCVKEQSSEGITYAPRITPNLAIINWENHSAKQIYDLSRALDSIYQLSTNWTNFPVKLQTISVCQSMENLQEKPGFSWYDKTLKMIKTRCKNDSCLSISKLIVNRKSINAIDFNNGYVKKTAVENRYFH